MPSTLKQVCCLSDKLIKMIRSHHSSGQKLAVGRSDYKRIIEAKLVSMSFPCLLMSESLVSLSYFLWIFQKIHCLFDEPVMELMWGLKNIMKSLLPAETCELTTESKGMQLILNKYGFKVEPEMVRSFLPFPYLRSVLSVFLYHYFEPTPYVQVDEDLITIATALYESDYCVNRFAEFLHRGGKYLKEVSGIDCQNLDLQKLVTALKLLSYPKEKIETGTSNEVNSNAIQMYNKLTAVHLLKTVTVCNVRNHRFVSDVVGRYGKYIGGSSTHV